MNRRLLVPRAILSEIERHVSGELPLESGGMLLGEAAGTDRIAREFAPLHSTAHSCGRYEAAADECVAAVYRAAGRAQVVVATVHSHPFGEAVPSETDLLEAFGYLSCWHVIVSFVQGQAVFGVYEYRNDHGNRSYAAVALAVV